LNRPAPRLVIVGGGFTGATVAVQAARRSPIAMDIVVVEPSTELGRGLPYQGSDPDHRVNGPIATHSIDPLDTGHVQRWLDKTNGLQYDSDAQCAFGTFLRRGDYGRYLHESVLEFSKKNESGSTIRHHRDRVRQITLETDQVVLELEEGNPLLADSVVLAFGNPAPRLPPMLQGLSQHPAVVHAPLVGTDLHQLCQGLKSGSKVAVMGTSLTAADVISTLLRQTSGVAITAFSRRGLIPHRQRPPDSNAQINLPKTWLIDRINGQVPSYLYPSNGSPWTVRQICRSMRQRIKTLTSQGLPWQQGFDEARDVVWQFWPLLSASEKQRFFRRLRVWYDVARFRLPPQTAESIDRAVAAGRLSFVAQALQSVEALDSRRLKLSVQRKGQQVEQEFDALINCTGFDLGGAVDPETLPGKLVQSGLLVRDESGIGFSVDKTCRVIDSNGQASLRVRLVGPATAGVFGDSLGAMFIAVQAHRMLPSLFNDLS
jgi:uncharacterized NAD(P)/FAD-binding protein YdhS